MKSVALSVVYSRATISRAGGLGRLLELVRQALAVGGAVVDDGDLFCAQPGHGKLAQHLALLRIVGHHAERGLEALFGVLGLVAEGEICGMPASW